MLPGLINAHEHLEFSLFPRLGQGPYPNAKAWADDIYKPGESPIKEHLQISKDDRLLWGGIKNLLSGVTTVCHHNPYAPGVFRDRFPVRVLEHFGWAHSLAFSPDLAEAAARTPPGWPFILHVAEATDEAGRKEIFQLDRLGVSDSRLVLVHGVGLDEQGLSLVRERGASIIWCPSSNLFTLGRTLDRRAFELAIPTALATDSSLTAGGDLLNELAVASRSSGLAAEMLYRMVTDVPARILRLRRGEGRLSEGGAANLLVVRDRGLSPAATLMQTRPEDIELVMLGGEIKLLSESLTKQVPEAVKRRLCRILVDGCPVHVADVNVGALLHTAEAKLGSNGPVRLAGRRIEA